MLHDHRCGASVIPSPMIAPFVAVSLKCKRIKYMIQKHSEVLSSYYTCV